MAWCRQAPSHYLKQCWPRSMSPYGITRPQWVNSKEKLCAGFSFFFNDAYFVDYICECLLCFRIPRAQFSIGSKPAICKCSLQFWQMGREKWLLRADRKKWPLRADRKKWPLRVDRKKWPLRADRKKSLIGWAHTQNDPCLQNYPSRVLLPSKWCLGPYGSRTGSGSGMIARCISSGPGVKVYVWEWLFGCEGLAGRARLLHSPSLVAVGLSVGLSVGQNACC